MEVDKFVNAVQKMREAQNVFFRLRKQSDLIISGRWERLVDQALKDGITKEITVEEKQIEWDLGR